MENKDIHKRNIGILVDRISGETVSGIARDYGVSATRVQQILRRHVLNANNHEALKCQNKELKEALLIASDKLAVYEDANRKLEAAQGRPINSINLSMRSHKGLRNAGYKTIEQVCEAKDHELLRIPNFGRKSLNEVKAVCAAYRMQE